MQKETSMKINIFKNSKKKKKYNRASLTFLLSNDQIKHLKLNMESKLFVNLSHRHLIIKEIKNKIVLYLP